MAVTYSDIFDDVCQRIDNDIEPKGDSFEGDGTTRVLRLSNRGICEEAAQLPLLYTTTLGVDTELIEDTDYVLDYQAGTVNLSAVVAEGTTLYAEYYVRYWSEQLLWRLINQALQSLYPSFYAITTLEPTLDDTTNLYPLTDDDSREITRVLYVEDLGSGTDYRLRPQAQYRVLRGPANALSLRLFDDPYGTVTATCAARPAAFAHVTDTLTDLELPESMRESIVLWTCWQALTQKLPRRVRNDTTTTIAQEGRTTFFDQVRQTTVFKALLDAELQANHMPPLTARGSL